MEYNFFIFSSIERGTKSAQHILSKSELLVSLLLAFPNSYNNDNLGDCVGAEVPLYYYLAGLVLEKPSLSPPPGVLKISSSLKKAGNHGHMHCKRAFTK